MRIKDQPLYFEATPVDLVASHLIMNRFGVFFCKCPYFNSAKTATSVDVVARIETWGPEVAIDDIAVSVGSSPRYFKPLTNLP